ncbi:hypothetical protein F4780DRAFT_738104 [Xylariomycetidae sp. FL0641]|nr:hypothetical protein F4780DRAFT_738104 [Xylariomycetidae sp. FL0641]
MPECRPGFAIVIKAVVDESLNIEEKPEIVQGLREKLNSINGREDKEPCDLWDVRCRKRKLFALRTPFQCEWISVADLTGSLRFRSPEYEHRDRDEWTGELKIALEGVRDLKSEFLQRTILRIRLFQGEEEGPNKRKRRAWNHEEVRRIAFTFLSFSSDFQNFAHKPEISFSRLIKGDWLDWVNWAMLDANKERIRDIMRSKNEGKKAGKHGHDCIDFDKVTGELPDKGYIEWNLTPDLDPTNVEEALTWVDFPNFFLFATFAYSEFEDDLKRGFSVNDYPFFDDFLKGEGLPGEGLPKSASDDLEKVVSLVQSFEKKPQREKDR